MRYTRSSSGLVFYVLRLVIVPAIAAIVGPAPLVRGAEIIYDDRDAFVQATGAGSVTGPVPNVGQVSDGVQLGTVTVSLSQGTAIFFGTTGIEGTYGPDFTNLIDGNDIGVTGLDGLTFGFQVPVSAAGFEFAEPTAQPPGAGSFVDSTYRVEGLDASGVVFTFEINVPNDTPTFVGVVSDTPFLTLRTVEIAGGIENEFYGQVYASLAPGECITPYEPVTIVEARRTAPGCVEFSHTDPNPSGIVSGYNVYRTSDASTPFELWDLVAAEVTDEDPVLPLVQWTDSGASVSPTGVWHYQFLAVNGDCPVQSSEGPR